jgi:hypothetical protein
LGLISFLAPLATLTSIVMLVLLLATGEVRLRGGVLLAALFLAAGYAQFFGASPGVSVIGLGCQTLLAVYLIVRWRLAS